MLNSIENELKNNKGSIFTYAEFMFAFAGTTKKDFNSLLNGGKIQVVSKTLSNKKNEYVVL